MSAAEILVMNGQNTLQQIRNYKTKLETQISFAIKTNGSLFFKRKLLR